MNAGMYGLPDGRGMQGRKLAGQFGRNAGASNIHNMGAASGALVAAQGGLSVGSRVNVLNISGRGAVRFLGVAEGSVTSGTFRVQVIIDGVITFDGSRSLSAVGDGFIPIGHCYSTTSPALWDFVPFENSVQVFATLPATGNYIYTLRVIDIHQ